MRDYPENLERVRKIVKELDRRPQQILVEATILAARLTDENALGVDFTMMGGIKLSDIKGIPQDARVAAMTGGVKNEQSGNAATGYSAGGTNFPSFTNTGLKIGVVYNDIAVFVQALEAVTDTVVLANPKVLTLNKQRGEVLVGREDGYLTTTVTETTATQLVEFLKTGTRLVFRPYIGDDGYIRMEVHPEDSDGKVVNGLPQKTTTEVTTNIMVKDGNTVVIGGLFRESSGSTRNQVPGLGSIPVIGALFKQQSDSTAREEIIILLTPHIIKDDSAYSAASQQQLKNMEMVRVGARRGMMFFGRERLAECCYDAAVSEMNKSKGCRKLAIWYLDCATNLNPLFLEAIKMKEGLTHREIKCVDNSSVRHFLRTEVMVERGYVPPARAGAQPVAAAKPVVPQSVAAAPTARPAAPATTPPQPSPTTRPADEKSGYEDEGMAKTPQDEILPFDDEEEDME